MKPRVLFAALAVSALPLLTGCADPSHAKEANSLKDALSKLPGVAKVDLRYSKPVTLDSGKLQLRVAMEAAADPATVIEVVDTTYERFSGTHRDEEGDLYVTVGDDTIHLRSFEPEADADVVKQATASAIEVLPAGAVTADIDTQDIDKPAHVFTTYAVTIAKKGADDVLRALTDLERTHGDIPDASWGVQTDDDSGWQLRSTKGFPGSAERGLFNRLREHLPQHASIQLVDDVVTAQVPDHTAPDRISDMVDRHLELLGGVGKAFYDVTHGGDFYAMITTGDCTFSADEIGTRLKRDRGADCTKVTAADS